MTMLAKLLIHIILLLSVAKGSTVISPSVCLRDGECGTNEYCDVGLPGSTNGCVPKLGEGAECTHFESHECAAGLYCGFAADDFVNLRCLRVAAKGAVCDAGARGSCEGERDGVRCSAFTEMCERSGFSGDMCYDDMDCQYSLGLYCRNSGSFSGGTCRPHLPVGAACTLDFNNFECDGVCANGGLDSVEGVCVPGSKLGEPCKEDWNCQGYDTSYLSNDADLVLCNVATGRTGICSRASLVIKTLGADCDPARDACDAGRGLSCRPVAGGHKCAQNATDYDDQVTRYCTPGSPISVCNPKDGVPTECRLDNGPLDFPSFPVFYGCLPTVETVPRGAMCGHVENVRCAPGTRCMEVPGVENFPADEALGPKFCVLVKKEGEFCGNNKFRFGCEDGLECRNRQCVKKTRAAQRQKMTHAYVVEDCNKLPCVPGTVCTDSSDGQFCSLPVVTVDEGGPCYRTALAERRCKQGLICATDEHGMGIKTCRRPFGVGAPCDDFPDCAGSLSCGNSKCYDKSKALKQGDACDPNAPLSGRRCAVDKDENELQCMAKGSGFVCQRVSDLFELCDASKNVACMKGYECNAHGVCIPGRKE